MQVIRRTAWLVLVLICGVSCRPGADDASFDASNAGLPVTRAVPREARQKLSPYLQRLVEAPAAGSEVRVLVDLSVQLDLVKLGDVLRRRGAGKHERRRHFIASLRQLADGSQRQLRPLLDRLQRDGSVDSYRGFSVVNRLVVTATTSAILELAERDEVGEIVEETTRDALVLTAAGPAVQGPPQDRSWALEAMGVDSLWRDGAAGRGIVIGIIDTGAAAVHEQLQGNFRGGANSWHDPSGGSPSPQDSRTGHGTTILSVAVGQNVADRELGVAPEAEWIACAGLPEGRYNNVTITECADWMLNVGQPDVLINAWLLPNAGCDHALQRIVDAWRSAEIVPVFSAGNDGPAAQSDRSPANYSGLYPGDGATLSVGGMSESGAALTSSSRGPGSCDGSIFPALVAPAEEILAALPLTPSAYRLAKGTSVAAGLAGGAAAVLLELYPQASVIELEVALRSSAVDLGPLGPDNTYGFGRLYLPAARDSLARWVRRRQQAVGDTSAIQRTGGPAH